MKRNKLVPIFEKIAAVAFVIFLLGISFLCFCYGIAQLYQINQQWKCGTRNGNCLFHLNDGSAVSAPTTIAAIDYSVLKPTPIGTVYCILFFMVGLGFLTLIILTFITIPKYNRYQNNYETYCCFMYLSKLKSFIPSRYGSTYHSCVWLISLQLKRCIFESLYLLQKGGIDILGSSSNIGVSNRVETKEKVLMFSILLGSNCILTSILYTFWWIYFKFSSVSFVIIIIFIESIYDIFFSLFPILSNQFKFGYMNFLGDVTNFLTTFFPLLYLLYTVKNSKMKYILPYINNNNSNNIQQEITIHNSLEIAFIDHTTHNSSVDLNNNDTSLADNNKLESDKLYKKKKYTVMFFILFFFSLGIFIMVGTISHLNKAEKYCSTDIVENWSSFYEIGCQVKLYPFLREYPCDCRTFEMNTMLHSRKIYPETTFQFGIRQFHHAQFIGIDHSIRIDLHFTQDMFVAKVLQVLNIDGTNIYLLDKLNNWKYLQILQLKAISSIENNGSSIGSLKYVESINLSGSTSIKYLPDSFCNLQHLVYFNCNGCKLYELPSCVGQLSKLVTLQLNFNNLKYFPQTFNKLKNTLNALYCYECIYLYKNAHFPSYILSNFTQLSFMELILYGTPICNNIEDESVETQQFLSNSFSCFEGCGVGCTPYGIANCQGGGDNCNVYDCNYGFGFCLEPECSNYNSSGYQSKMNDIHYNKTCYLEYNTSECQYGFGNCIEHTNSHDNDVCYVEPPYLFNKTLQCGTICEPEWLNELLWCDESCMNYSNGVYGTQCPYHYQNNECRKCTGYCGEYQTVWNYGLGRASCDWISGCFVTKFGIPNVQEITGNNYLKDITANESLTDWWYKITNNSVSLMTPLNYHQTLYYLGPYLDVKQFAACWNLSHSRISQITCEKCFGSAWNADVTQHKVNGTCDETTIDDWVCN